jgi:hypothetical protein
MLLRRLPPRAMSRLELLSDIQINRRDPSIVVGLVTQTGGAAPFERRNDGELNLVRKRVEE